MMIKKISILLVLISIINTGLYFYSFTNNDSFNAISAEEWPGHNWY